jgi:Secretion system C-terminal sorting domain
MKKRYYLGAALCLALAGNVQAQSMSENFDGWTNGSYMGVNSTEWSTWSGATGGAEDCQVTTAQANSGANSIYFMSTVSTGGPQDVIVPFGGEHNTGDFNWNSDFYVEANQGAYFNFQANNTVGEVWSFNCQMHNNGTITFDDGSTIWVTDTYPSDTWFNIEIDVDLNTNTWEVILDGVSLGDYTAVVGQIASIDIFPVNSSNGGNNNSSFYVDNFNYTHTAFTLPAENAAVSYIDDLGGVATADIYPTVTVRNLGTSAITSFDLECDYDGNQITENITGVNIASMGEMEVTFANPLVLASGTNDITATVSNVNGNGADGNAADDSKVVSITTVTPAPGKVVVGEEATGTWCQWCPRGAVFMDMMADVYPDHWAGIAVHNGDPMAWEPYDTPMSAAVSASYPSALVDRGAIIDPSEMEADFNARVVLPPVAFVSNGAEYDAGSGMLRVSVTCDFQATVTGTHRLAMVLTEDNLSGTSSSWAQVNAYAGGGAGVMGGYESLPSPVPASQMVYDHVARVILPSFGGFTGAFPSTDLGDEHTVIFELQVDPSWDFDEMHVVGMLIDPSGDIDNAGYTTLNEALTNGLTSSTIVVTEVEELSVSAPFEMYPNPTQNGSVISLTDLENDEVVVNILDMNGKVIATRNYGQLSGAYQLPINTTDYAAGIYSVQLKVGDNQNVQKLIVE